MDMGSIEPYRINNEYNISEILAHFDSNYIFHTLEDKLEHIDYTSSIIEPNFVGAFESNFKLMEEEYPGDSQNIRTTRDDVYREIIRILCQKFNLEFNNVDDTIDVYTAAYYLYDFLVCNRNTIMVNFFTAFIINNKDNLYNALGIEDIRKNKDSSSIYGKRVYTDMKYAIISANIMKVIKYINNLDIGLVDIFKSVYVDYSIVTFMDNAIADRGNFFKDYYCSAINNPELAPIIITNIRLSLQKLVGDISATHIDEIMASSPSANE